MPGRYDVYGPRVPAVVVSGYAKPHAVTNVVHDHTSILATIEAKWNLPAMTYRDANAHTIADFLDHRVRFPEPPSLAAPSDLATSERGCKSAAPKFHVYPNPPVTQHLTVRFEGHRRGHSGLWVVLYCNHGTLSNVTVELRRRGHVRAAATAHHVDTRHRQLALRGRHRTQLAKGRYRMVVRRGRAVLFERLVTVR